MPYRKLELNRCAADRAYWRAQFWDPQLTRWKRVNLFSRTDPRFYCSSRMPEGQLKEAWSGLARGKTPTLRQAALRAEEIDAELSRPSVLLDRLFELELSSPGRRGPRAVGTMNSLRLALERFREFLAARAPELSVHDLKPLHVQEFLASRRATGVCESTVANERAYLHRTFQRGVELEYLARNPVKNVRVQRPAPRDVRARTHAMALEPGAVAALLRACREPFPVSCVSPEGVDVPMGYSMAPPRYLYPFVLMALRTGARRGELLATRRKDRATGDLDLRNGLCWRDVDFEKHLARVDGKTGPRSVPLTPDVERELMVLRGWQMTEGFAGRGGQVFLADDGQPVLEPRKAFHAACKRAGLSTRTRVHDLRHTCFTELAARGVPPAIICKLAGHASLQMTQHYTHIGDEAMIEQVLRAQA